MANILWLSWKDIKNPQAGGAEHLGDELRKRLAKDGHKILHVTSLFPNARRKEIIDDVNIERIKCNKFTYSFKSLIYVLHYGYAKAADVIIEEINTSPSFISLFYKKKTFLSIHQLAKDVWNYETPFPLNIIGKYVLEPIALWISSRNRPNIITISKSSKKDLINNGFKKSRINIIPMATIFPLNRELLKKEKDFTVLYFGSLRKMKRPEEVIKAFAYALKDTKAKLWISGKATEARERKLKSLIKTKGIFKQTKWWGSIDDNKKEEIMKRAHIISMTSAKEGWGIVISEAGVVSTPSVVYNVDGLRDSTKDQITGIVVENNNYKKLGETYKELMLNKKLYNKIQKETAEYNRKLTFDKTHERFKEIINVDK